MDSEFANGRALKAYIDQAVDLALRKIIALQNLEADHAFSAGVTLGLTSTINNPTSLVVTPKVTGKYRIMAAGSILNASTTQAAVSFQLQIIPNGASLPTVVATTPIEVPGNSTVGFTTPQVQWAVLAETTAGAAFSVGLTAQILVNAGITSGITNTLSIITGSQLSVQEIL